MKNLTFTNKIAIATLVLASAATFMVVVGSAYAISLRHSKSPNTMV